MITLPGDSRLIQDTSDLPRLPDVIETLYADFETTSGDDAKDSLNPWFDCEALGLAFTWNDVPGAWYLPARHRWGDNLPVETLNEFWRDLVSRTKWWVNHNVKYDAHVSDQSCGVNTLEYARRGLRYRDTVTTAKIVNSDRFTYSLDSLCHDWLPPEFRKRGDLLKPFLRKTKDYGVTPSDVMAEYACGDVIVNRELDRFIERRVPEECRRVWDTETRLTEMLINAERIGVRVEPTELKIAHATSLYRMLEIEESLHTLTGTYVRPSTNADCHDLLCNRYGLPVLGWTKGGDNPDPAKRKPQPSFDKDTLKLYLARLDAPREIVEQLLEYRKLSTFVSLFAEPYQRLERNGVMHTSFNQSVRTGRMSASKPNMQQLGPPAKALIRPHDGFYFQTNDASQIEFRTIVSKIEDKYAIDEYNKNPWTDFHQWVAEMCAISRKPAKTVNFMMGYGGGRKKTVKVLSSSDEVAAEIMRRMLDAQVPEKQRVAMFDAMTRKYAEDIYETYHLTLPTLKPMSRLAEQVAKRRGYVRNSHGRHRHLPYKFAHRAFNTVCQGEAADILKERAVALYDATRGTGIEPVCLVHDEFLTLMPVEYYDDLQVAADIVGILEKPDVPLRVPIRWSHGVGKATWLEASLDAERRDKAGDHVTGTDGELREYRQRYSQKP